MPFISTALAVGLGVAGAGVASSAIGAHAAGQAAKTQAQAAEDAAQLQHEDAQAALAFQNKEWETQQKNLAPWLSAGKGALGELTGLTSTPGEGLLTPFGETFKAPTAAEAAATPGYQFTLNQGETALQNSAAARGGALSGGTAKDIANYAEGLASTTYQQTFNNVLTQYQQAFNKFETNQTNTYNRLAGIAGTGQTAATTLGSEGSAAANNVSNTMLTSGAQIGQQLNNAGAATASGYVGQANAINSGISGISGYLQLQQMLNAQKTASPAIDPYAGQTYQGPGGT
jgi:hypothetical protein